MQSFLRLQWLLVCSLLHCCSVVRACVHMYILYVCVYVCGNVCMYIYVYVYVYVHVWIYTHVYVYVYAYLCIDYGSQYQYFSVWTVSCMRMCCDCGSWYQCFSVCTKCIYKRTQARLERRRGSERARSRCRPRKLCISLSFDAIKPHFAPPMQGLHCTHVLQHQYLDLLKPAQVLRTPHNELPLLRLRT